MAKSMTGGKYGKDSPDRFIEGALTGGSGPSNGIEHYAIDRPDQVINTPTPANNVKLAMDIPSSIKGDVNDFGGGVDNLKHSLTGASAVNDEVGAAGPVKHVIIPNH